MEVLIPIAAMAVGFIAGWVLAVRKVRKQMFPVAGKTPGSKGRGPDPDKHPDYPRRLKGPKS